MSAVDLPRTPPSPRAALVTLIALHVPYVLAPVLYVAVNLTGTAGYRPVRVVVALLVAVPAGLLQLRHSLAAAAGHRPAAWPATYIALAALTLVPLPWFGLDWAGAQLMLVA